MNYTGSARKIWSLFFVLLGAGILMLKRGYSGPLDEYVHAYAGNVSVSFALYFLFTNLQAPPKLRKFAAAAIALVAVESFEIFNGFGVMANTYDPIDLVANAVGVATALGLDCVLEKTLGRLPERESHRSTQDTQ